MALAENLDRKKPIPFDTKHLDKLMEAQTGLGQRQPGGGPLTMTGGRKGMGGGSRPGGFGPVVDGLALPRHPFADRFPIATIA